MATGRLSELNLARQLDSERETSNELLTDSGVATGHTLLCHFFFPPIETRQAGHCLFLDWTARGGLRTSRIGGRFCQPTGDDNCFAAD